MKEHFEEVLNVDYTGTESSDGTRAVAGQQLPEIPSERGTIIRLKNGKSLRMDSIRAKMLKCA